MNPLFITQKKCLRVLFGDSKAYNDKFKTCARTRAKEYQLLSTAFFEKEHSKPIFNKNNLLTVHHLYKYYCLLEMFKIIKLRMPISLYSMFNRSNRRINYFITPSPSTSFIYQSTYMWNTCHKHSKTFPIDFSTSINCFKTKLKNELLNVQKLFSEDSWLPPNYGIADLTF